MKNYFIILMALILINPPSYGQELDPRLKMGYFYTPSKDFFREITEEEIEEYQEIVVNQSEFIIEATIFRSETFYTENPDRYFHSATAVINKIIKGGDKLNYGTIEFVNEITDSEYTMLEKKNIVRYIDNPGPAIWFCRQADSDIPSTSVKADNSIRVESMEVVGVRKFSLAENRDWGITTNFMIFDDFETAGEIYDYLDQFPGVSVPEGKSSFEDYELNLDSLKNELGDHNIILKKKENPIESGGFKFPIQGINSLDLQEVGVIGPVTNSLDPGQTTITYSLGNPAVYVEENKFFFEFDVQAKTNSKAFLSYSKIQFTYNSSKEPQTFFKNSSQSKKITIENGSAAQDKYVATTTDKGEYKIEVAFNLKDGTKKPSTIELGSSPVNLYRVRLELANKNKEANLLLTDFSNANVQNNYSLGKINEFYWFKEVKYTNTLNPVDVLVPPEEFTVANKTINAGTGEILRIFGSNFGNGRGTAGTVFFKNADTGGKGDEVQANDMDFLVIDTDGDGVDDAEYWTNNEIRVKVSSFIFNNELAKDRNLIVKVGTAGTGEIRVRTAWEDEGKKGDGSPLLVIPYARSERVFGVAGPKYKVHLTDLDREGGMSFRLDESLKKEPQMVVLIEQALEELSCAFNINLNLSTSGSVSNMIMIDNNLGNNVDLAAMSASSRFRLCSSCQATSATAGCSSPLTARAFYYESTIRIRKTGITWGLKRPGESLPSGQTDFYQAFLHEMGHVLGLDHIAPGAATNTLSEIMYYQTQKGPESARDRIDLSDGSFRSHAQTVISESMLIDWKSCELANRMTPSTSFVCASTYAVPPKNLVATQEGSRSIKLTWSSALGYRGGYVIERSADRSDYIEIARVPDYITSYVDIGDLKVSPTYRYRIKAISDSGESEYAYSEDIKLPGDLVTGTNERSGYAYPEVGNIDIHVFKTAGYLILTWDNDGYESSAFTIYRSTNPKDIGPVVGTSDVRSFKDKTVQANVVYYYRIRGNKSEDVSYQAVGVLADEPSAPSNLVLRAIDPTRIVLQWNDNSSVETAYIVERTESPFSPFVEIARLGRNSYYYNDSGLDPYNAYFYRVRALNLTVFSDYSNPANTSTPADPCSKTGNPTAINFGVAGNITDPQVYSFGTITVKNTSSVVRIPSGANVVFEARNQIVLDQGFEAQRGSAFVASVVGCYDDRTPQLRQGTTGSKDSLTVVGVEEESDNEIKIFPNPTKNRFTISHKVGDEYHLRIYNTNGLIIIDRLVSNPLTEIDLSSYARGLYLIDVFTKSREKWKGKMIKE